MVSEPRPNALCLDDFRGDWRVARRIVQADGTVALADGIARFIPDAAGLIQSEAGTLRMPGTAPMRFERRYLWRAENGAIALFFEDGRPFHSFSADRTEAGHDCAPDRYDVAYSFDLPEAWSSTWTVLGPRKNYRMETRYCR